MEELDIAIIGAGPTGLATAIEAQRRGLTYRVFDKGCITNSILGFPTHMVFFTTPELTPSTVEIVQAGTPHSIRAHQVFLLTGYRSSTKFFHQLGVTYDLETLRPQHSTETYETNVPGVYLAGSVTGGKFNAEVFIENGRFHGERVVAANASGA